MEQDEIKKTNDYYIREAMRSFGGSFVQALAECLEHADPINYAKLEAAFPEYIKEYQKIVNEN